MLLERKSEGGHYHGADNHHTDCDADYPDPAVSVLSKHSANIAYMREFKKRRTIASEILRISIGATGALVLAAAAFGAFGAAWNMYGKFAAAAAARAAAGTQVRNLEDRYAKIHAEVEAFASERGIEGAVREHYGVAKPGEVQIDIVRQSTTTEEVWQQAGFVERLWKMLLVW